MNDANILLIDDDPVVRSLISGILTKKGYQVTVAREGQEGLARFDADEPDLVITDYRMPGMSGIDVLNRIREKNAGTPVIILTAYGDATVTIRSMQTGAFDIIEKPVNPRELLDVVGSGLSTVAREGRSPGDAVVAGSKKDENLMVGKSNAMRNIFKQIGRISQSNVNVLVVGETGTGKERLARLIHNSGSNPGSPLVYVNCKSLAEAQLQAGEGTAPGAAAGETIDEKFRKVGNGTLILDEIGLLSPNVQTRLLDILEYDVGAGKKEAPRVVSITSQDIPALIGEELFLKELYYRLNVIALHLPPLRERTEDIPELVQHILQELTPAFDKKIVQVEPGAIKVLQSYGWPGNIQELRNVLMQAMVLSHGELLGKKHIRIDGKIPEIVREESFPETPPSLAEIEKEHIGRVLTYTKWNKQQAASILGITRPTLNAKIERYGLTGR